MRTLRFIFVVIAVNAIIFAVSAAQSGDDEGLLNEDYVLGGVDGKMTESESGAFFEFETDISDGRVTLKAGEAIELLRSATLEKMAEDAKTRSEARYRLWGKITKFEGKNFIFPTYFLALRKLEKPTEQQVRQGGTPQAVNDANDIVKIPDEIVKKLQTSEVLPAAEMQQAQLQLKQDTIFANRNGRVIEKEGRFLFEPDGLGRGVEKFAIELSPCEALQKTIEEIRGEPNPVRFNVAGILTIYKGQQYLLLQKATRIYSYGNFGR